MDNLCNDIMESVGKAVVEKRNLDTLEYWANMPRNNPAVEQLKWLLSAYDIRDGHHSNNTTYSEFAWESLENDEESPIHTMSHLPRPLTFASW